MATKIMIYVLKDPNTNEIRYVGKTRQTLSARLKGHIAEANSGSTSHKSNWIRSLGGQKPIIVPYCDVEGFDVDELERQAIAVARAAGYRLTNMTDGGDGGWSDAARAAIPRRPCSDETKMKIGDANRGKTASVEARQKIREARARQVIHCADETKTKIAATLTGRSNGGGWKLSTETRARQSIAAKEREARRRAELRSI